MSQPVPYRVRFVNPQEAYRRLKSEIDKAWLEPISHGDLVLRQQLRDFETNLASFVGCRFAVGLSSGYHALHLSLVAAGIGQGDEVIVPAHTFVASVSAIVHAGASPVLVDVGRDYNVDPASIKRALTRKTKAIMAVHLNGRLCDMDAIEEIAGQRKLLVIEDAAQALGASFRSRMAGSFGITGCFSFYPFKALGGFGDGGAITTNDEALARTVTLLRYNGEDRQTGEYHYHGYTALLDNVQASVLDVKLRHLPAWVVHRCEMAHRYRKGLQGVGDLALPHFDDSRYSDSFQNYVIRTRRRDALREHLRKDGIETLVHWPKPMWEHRGLGLPEMDLRETVSVSAEVISLPMSAETTTEDVDIAVESIRSFYAYEP